ncbi:MAG: isochorismatase family protein [Planctomycetes bacterium]|nr:isochorismatase family protein [Planctomycetota bacterium]
MTRFTLQSTALIIVDVQEKLLPHMHNAGEMTAQVARLIDGASAIGLPVFVTEQYRKGLGTTVPELASRLTGAVANHEKMLFSACIDPVMEELRRRGVRGVVVCGIEAHVCVLQTCLDLRDAGLKVGLVTDAIGSRRRADQEAAVSRMTQAGVTPTTVESILLELVREAGTPLFKAVLPVIK